MLEQDLYVVRRAIAPHPSGGRSAWKLSFEPFCLVGSCVEFGGKALAAQYIRRILLNIRPVRFWLVGLTSNEDPDSLAPRRGVAWHLQAQALFCERRGR